MPRKITTNTAAETTTTNTQNNVEDATEQVVARKKTGRRPKSEPQVTQETHDTHDTQEVQETVQSKQDTPDTHQQERNNDEWEEGDGVQVITHQPQVDNHDDDEHESEPVRVTTRADSSDRFVRASRQQSHQQNQQRPYQPRHQRTESTDDTRHQQRPKSTALAFSYNDYKNFSEPASKASTPELLRVLIARAHEDGQVHLKRCLETTLRAVNLECKFPTLPPPRKPFNGARRE